MTVDASAVAAWGADAAAYERSRPAWPAAALDWLCEGLDDSAAVLDLAAGTGKLTRALVERGYAVTAVEPLPGMRAQLEAHVDDVRDGVAEAIPAGDGEFAMVFVAEAFHWFATPAAVAEMRRVAARIGLLWNFERWDIEDVLAIGPSRHRTPRGEHGLAGAEERRFGHVHRAHLPELVGTWSRVAGRPDRDAVLARVRAYAPEPVELEYETLAVRA